MLGLKSAYLDCLAGGHCIGSFVDQVCSMEADDVHSKNLSRVISVDQLCHAFTLLLSKRLHQGSRPQMQSKNPRRKFSSPS